MGKECPDPLRDAHETVDRPLHGAATGHFSQLQDNNKYEQLRQARIARNIQLLQRIGVTAATQYFSAALTTPSAASKIRKDPSAPRKLPERHSSRLSLLHAMASKPGPKKRRLLWYQKVPFRAAGPGLKFAHNL